MSDPVTPGKIESFAEMVVARGGRVELVAKDALVIGIDTAFVEELRALPSVRLIGGVGIPQRRVPVIKRVT
ncbi:MAG: hypothetical protein GWP10_16800, partial [Nitrospiraceae bacterium]|nr:hypothetical protein [Nitrospiraceae bacterium]